MSYQWQEAWLHSPKKETRKNIIISYELLSLFLWTNWNKYLIWRQVLIYFQITRIDVDLIIHIRLTMYQLTPYKQNTWCFGGVWGREDWTAESHRIRSNCRNPSGNRSAKCRQLRKMSGLAIRGKSQKIRNIWEIFSISESFMWRIVLSLKYTIK